jgi:hypothetical protein
MHIYGHPALKFPVHLMPGQIVEHRYQPGVPLEVVSGPHVSLTTNDQYIVKTPNGAEEPVLKRNLKTEG